MKTLKNLNDPIDKRGGNPNEIIPRIKDVLIDSLYYGKYQNGADSIKAFRLAEKLYMGNGKDKEGGMDLSVSTVELEDAEFELMKEVVNRNPANFFVWCHASVMLKILEWEKNGT